MKFIKFFVFLLLAITVITCTTTQSYMEPTRARQLKPTEVSSYHNAINMKIAWFTYKELELKKTKENNWVMVESDTARTSVVPVIMITYPNSNDSIWIDMNIKNQLLGKLILKYWIYSSPPINVKSSI